MHVAVRILYSSAFIGKGKMQSKCFPFIIALSGTGSKAFFKSKKKKKKKKIHKVLHCVAMCHPRYYFSSTVQ